MNDYEKMMKVVMMVGLRDGYSDSDTAESFDVEVVKKLRISRAEPFAPQVIAGLQMAKELIDADIARIKRAIESGVLS